MNPEPSYRHSISVNVLRNRIDSELGRELLHPKIRSRCNFVLDSHICKSMVYCDSRIRGVWIMEMTVRTITLVATLVSTFIATVIVAVPASAFGTITRAGQNAEHGRITRRALACKTESAAGTCFEEKTLDSLAGKSGTFGAVGAPDRGRGNLRFFAHCSGGDYLDVPGYPQSKAEAKTVLTECRTYMAENLTHAVTDAAKLVNDKGELRSSAVSMRFGCTYRGSTHGPPKMQHFGPYGANIACIAGFLFAQQLGR